MATLTITLRSNRRGKNEPVYIRFRHKGKSGYINTGKVAMPSHRKGLKITDKRLLLSLNADMAEFSNRLLSLGRRAKNMSFESLFKFIKNDVEGPTLIEAKKEMGKRWVDVAVSGFVKFYGEDPLLKDITVQDVNSYIDAMMKRGLKNSVIRQYVATLSSVYNFAMRAYIDADIFRYNPFTYSKDIEVTPPKKRDIDMDVLKKLLTYDGELTKNERMALDVFIFEFCMCGMNVADIYHMPMPAYDGERITFTRHKVKKTTKAVISLKMPSVVLPIFERLRCEEGDFLFPFKEKHTSSKVFVLFVNRNVARITKRLNLPKVTSYNIRHTWATIAYNDVHADYSTVALALGHKMQGMTNRYINFGFDEVDKVNEKVLNLIFPSGRLH